LSTVKIEWNGARFTETRDPDETEIELIKDSINLCLTNHSPTSLAAAIRWLIRAKICKKRSQTENKSLAFESRKELIDSQMEHVQVNELSRFKLMDSNVQLSDLLISEQLEESLNAQPVGINSIARMKPNHLAEFLTLSQKMITERLTLKNDMPEKLVLLSITEEEKDKIERENSQASLTQSSIEEDEMGTVEGFAKKAKDHYKQILVNRGCYKIVPKQNRPSKTKTDECFSRNTTLIPSEIIAVYTKQTKDNTRQNLEYFMPEKFGPPPLGVSKNARVRKLVAYCETLDYMPTKARRVENAMEWLLPVLARAEVPGLDIATIVNRVEDEPNVNFDLDELADAIQFLTVNKFIHKLGVSHEKYVHHKYAAEWFMPLPKSESVDQRRTGDTRSALEKSGSSHLLRPWNDLDGRLSLKVFGIFISAVVDLIFSNPGIKQAKIVEHFMHRILSPVGLLDFLERLERSKIIKSEKVQVESSPMPFADKSEDDDKEVIYYECTPDAIELTAKLLHHIQKSK